MDSYHNLLEHNFNNLELNNELNRSCARHGDCPKTSIYPYFCKKELKDKLIPLSQKITSSVNQHIQSYFQCPENYPQLEIPSFIQQYVLPNKMFSDQCPVIRVDCFIGEDGLSPQILEINSAEPSGYAWHDLMVTELLNNSTISSFFKSQNIEVDFLLPPFLKMTETLFSEYKGKNLKLIDQEIKLIMPSDSTVYFDFVTFNSILIEQGYKSELISPKNFYVNSDAIYIRDSFEDLISLNGDILAKSMLEEILKQSVFMITPSSSVVSDQKSLLPYLNEELPIIKSQHLTQTTQKEFLANKNLYVLKPSQGYGGYGILIGKNTTQEIWNKRINDIITSNQKYIVQEFVEPDKHFDYLNSKEVYSNFSFWIINGEYSGAFARTSDLEIINFHQGGALIPVAYY